MSREKKDFSCSPNRMASGCCRVDSIVSVDGKGQIYLNNKLREKLKIDTGDRLIVVSLGDPNDPNGLVLLKADDFGDIVRSFLGPIMKDLFSNDEDLKLKEEL